MPQINFLPTGSDKSGYTVVGTEQPTTSVSDVLDKFGGYIVETLHKNLGIHRATGDLATSITFDVQNLGTSFRFRLSLLDYYKYIDEGRKPGGKFPPPPVILEWMGYKRLQVADKSVKSIVRTKGAHKTAAAISISKTKSLAYLIGRKIAKKGIAPTNFYSSVVNDELLNNLRSDLSKAFKRDIIVQFANIS